MPRAYGAGAVRNGGDVVRSSPCEQVFLLAVFWKVRIALLEVRLGPRTSVRMPDRIRQTLPESEERKIAYGKPLRLIIFRFCRKVNAKRLTRMGHRSALEVRTEQRGIIFRQAANDFGVQIIGAGSHSVAVTLHIGSPALVDIFFQAIV